MISGQASIASPLTDVVSAQHNGEAKGITSICSANPLVIEAAFRHALPGDNPVLIESTCNQVNQFGGYTGMMPTDFAGFVGQIADACGFPRDRLILGGDHLGPSPWQHEPAHLAMEKARILVQACVQAGYSKIHLDASMKCGDDEPHRPMDKALSARRAADLAVVAEEAHRFLPQGSPAPAYVIGTEVPLPGGVHEQEDVVDVTAPADVAETIEITRQAFLERGLAAAWQRVIAVVVQPGVEYGDSSLFEYNRDKALGLSRFIEGHPGLVYEAHSTDYQTAETLRQLVEDHFAILKVGPALTFALREAVFALELAEEEWLAGMPGVSLSRAGERLEQAMLANPGYWQAYYRGDEGYQRFARKYSFSDRSRYYWPVPEVQEALSRLISNLEAYPPPLSLLSQFLPLQYERVRAGQLANTPRLLVLDKITSVLVDYAHACRPLGGQMNCPNG